MKYEAHVIMLNTQPKHVHIGEYSEAFKVMVRMKENLQENGFNVVTMNKPKDRDPNIRWHILPATYSRDKLLDLSGINNLTKVGKDE